MKIKINQILVGEDGKTPIQDKDDIFTLKKVCISAVLNPIKDEDFNKKMEKYVLWKRLLSADEEIELSSEEITLLKQSIDKCFVQLILGQSVELLEQKS
jgi:hypothetical protein